MDRDALTKIECREVLIQLGVFLDQGDHAQAADLFADDGVLVSPVVEGGELAGAELRAFIEARPQEIKSRHVITNILVSPTGSDRADASAYALIYAAETEAGAAPPYELAGSPSGAMDWEVSLVRTDTGWKIKRYAAIPAMLPAADV